MCQMLRSYIRKLEFGKKKQEKTCRGFKDLTTTILCVQLNCQYKRRAGDKDVLLCGETEARAAVPLAPLVSNSFWSGESFTVPRCTILATQWNQPPSLFWPCPHFSFPRYQISIQPAWHRLTHHLFHAPLYFANDAWRCNVANLTALPMLKGYSPLIKAEVRPFIASSSPLIVLGVSQPECCLDNKW